MAFYPPMRTVHACWKQGDYFHPAFMELIPANSVRTVFELGCHDGTDTVGLYQKFQAPIHAFECNPETARRARTRFQDYPHITLVEKAVWDSAGSISFFPVHRTVMNGKTIENPGASSCFLARPDYLQVYEQHEITVEAIRLDSYCRAAGVESIDLLCMDVQGAALHALRGLGDWLPRVRYVIAEIENRAIYHGQSLLPEVHACLSRAGFHAAVRVVKDGWFSDYLYVNLRR